VAAELCPRGRMPVRCGRSCTRSLSRPDRDNGRSHRANLLPAIDAPQTTGLFGACLSHTAFELLLDIERRSRARAGGLPVQEEVREEWGGIAFSIAGNVLVAALEAVAEIATPPGIANVPGVKPWVLGIANMRGTLLPIVDLQGFLFGRNLSTDVRAGRVLVVECGGHASGLLVDAVAGLKRFWVDERSEDLPTLDPEFRPYVRYAYRSGGEPYALFNVSTLVESESFLDVAV
jgi:twitching motility protein PilI